MSVDGRIESRPRSAASDRSSDLALPATLAELFGSTRERDPEAVALDTSDCLLSYRTLSQAAEEVAERLALLGVGPGDRVGVQVPSGSAELYVAILGVLLSGAAYVPVDADDPADRAEMIWSSAGVCSVIEQGLQIRGRSAAVGSGRVPGPDDEAWIIFTSGSTGEPKGVAVTHRSAVAFVLAEKQLWTVDPGDRVLAGLSVAFDASCEELWLAWGSGAALVPAPRDAVRSGLDFGVWLVDHRITVISTVPTLASLWDDHILAGVRLLILGGEACSDELGWRLARGRETWNTYGPTEATVVTTAARVVPGRTVTIGTALPGWQVAVVDPTGTPVGRGQTGELVIGGVGLGRYLDPELDQERYAALPALGWDRSYRSGDMVRETEHGLAFVGREDDQVKIAGRRIELGEVEELLRSVAGVRQGAVVMRKTPSGTGVLACYFTGDVDASQVLAGMTARLPHGVVPLVFAVDEFPLKTSGKIDRLALPWPPPETALAGAGVWSTTAAWLSTAWADQLGPLPMTASSDFFAIGGNSVAAAKLVSVLRERYPTVTVADLYDKRTLAELADHLDSLARQTTSRRSSPPLGSRAWEAVQLLSVVGLIAAGSPRWIIAILVANNLAGGSLGPHVGWPWLIVGWLLFGTAPGRAVLAAGSRRLLLRHLRPGRYPRRGAVACRIWFADHLVDGLRLKSLAGTPWAARYARLCGAEVGTGAELNVLPSATSLVSIGAGATIENDVDLGGWWIEGSELVLGAVRIGAGASIGARVVLMPGAAVGDGAEIEPASVVLGEVPAGERWAGSPAVYVGPAGEDWPVGEAPRPRHQRAWTAMYAVGLVTHNLAGLLAVVPSVLVEWAVLPSRITVSAVVEQTVVLAPALVLLSLLTYAVVTAVLFRTASRLLRPGAYSSAGGEAWAVWFTHALMEGAMTVMFPVYSSVFTRTWLRSLGIDVARRTEMSHAVTINRLVSLGETSFSADDVGFLTSRRRGGWLRLGRIGIGSRTFLGNGAVLEDGTRVGDDGLIGVLSVSPISAPDGSSWFGVPALELPRIPDTTDPALTTDPSRRRFAARAATEIVRIVVPSTISLILATLLFAGLDVIGREAGGVALVAATPFAILIGGIAATIITVVLKWLLIGTYRASDHPLWSHFIWRDEIMNSCQEGLAGSWLLGLAGGTALMPIYLRAMGARIGRDVWFETLNVTEFDMVTVGDGCAVNRGACIETHLFQDRLMRIGPLVLEQGVTLGPYCAVLPNTRLGAECTVGARSVVLRGEELPAATTWQGAPVRSV